MKGWVMTSIYKHGYVTFPNISSKKKWMQTFDITINMYNGYVLCYVRHFCIGDLILIHYKLYKALLPTITSITIISVI